MPVKDVSEKPSTFITCLFCKMFNTDTNKCSEGEIVTNPRQQVCDKWKYIA